MAIERTVFGKTPEGREIFLYTLTNNKGMKATVTDIGAGLVDLIVPDKDGKPVDVVLGFDNTEDYFVNSPCFGVVVGPSANRIGGAVFELDGVQYDLQVNDNTNNLHSHNTLGYQRQIWESEVDADRVIFTMVDGDGSMGFPGNKKMTVTYSLDEENGLTLRYSAVSDKATILNPTNHTYFNLDGHDSGSVLNHELMLKASCYTPVVAGAIPTGEIASVKGTPMDFTEPKVVGEDIDADFEQLNLTGGFDHNWVIDGWDGELRHFATLKGAVSGITMKAYTTLPGVQFYAGNMTSPMTGKGGASYGPRTGMCLETQYFPDTVHHVAFPSCVFGGERGEYDSVTVFRFE